MKRNSPRHIAAWELMVLLLLTLTTGGHSQQPAGKPDAQTVSQTGLLPVYGVDFTFDPAWVDGAQFPSQSANHPNFGVSAAFQQVWDTLKPSGFNVIRFPVDVRDGQGAPNRVANLCVWAKNNNVKLVPILVGADRGQPLGVDFSQNAAAFVKNLMAAFKKGGASSLGDYTQILLYQVENNMNHTGLHGAMPAQLAQLRLVQAVGGLRRAEQESLKDTGIGATPVMINLSFDYELIKARAIAGATWNESAYAQAQKALKDFVAELAAGSDIDTITVEWLPGSQSAGSVDKFPELLRSVSADLAGKQILLTTGYSTAFHTTDEQKNYYAVTFANLADYRASQGLTSPFIGIFFHEATNGKEPNPVSPSPSIATEMTGWDWSAKADELQRMWKGEASSDAIRWWVTKVENNMGLLSLKVDSAGTPSITEQPAQQGLQQIATAVSEANAAVSSQQLAVSPPGTTPVIPQAAAPPGSGGSGTTSGSPLKEHFQAGLAGILDSVFNRLGSIVGTAGTNRSGNSYGASSTGSGGSSSAVTPAQTDPPAPGTTLQIHIEASVQSGSLRKGTPVNFDVKLSNQSTASDAAGLLVSAVEETTGSLLDMGSQVSDIAIPKGSTRNVTVTWIPAEARTYNIAVEVKDGLSFNKLDSARLGSLTVAAAQETAPTPDPGAGAGGAVPSPPGTGAGSGGVPSPPATQGTGSKSGTSLISQVELGGQKKRRAASDTTLPSPATDTRGLKSDILLDRSLRFNLPVGLPQITGLQIAGSPGGRGVPSTPAAKAEPAHQVNFSVINAYSRPLLDVNVSLLVDGKIVQTRPIGPLLPKQSRSIAFANVALPAAGSHEITVALESAGPKPLTGSVTTRVSMDAVTAVAGERRASGGLIPPGLPAQGGTTAANTTSSSAGTRILTGPPVRSALPPTFSVGRTVVASGDTPGGATGGTRGSTAATATVRESENRGIDRANSRSASADAAGSRTWNQSSEGSDLAVSMSASPDPVIAGTNLMYKITVTNNGLNQVPGYVLSVPVPPGTTFQNFGSSKSLASAPGSPASTLPPKGGMGTITQTRNPTLMPNESITFWLEVQVNASAPSSSSITNTATVSSRTMDPMPANNTSTTKTRIDTLSTGSRGQTGRGSSSPLGGAGQSPSDTRPPGRAGRPDVAVSSSDIRYSPATPKPGDILVVTVTVHNYGDGDADSVSVGCRLGSSAQGGFTEPIKPGDFKVRPFRFQVPQGSQWNLDVSVDAPRDANPRNNNVAITIRGAAPHPPYKRH